MSFTIADGPRQRSHSQVRLPRDSWPHITVPDSRLPQPGGPSPRIYIPQDLGGQVIPLVTGFPFRRHLQFAGLRWKYSTPPSHGNGWLSTDCTALFSIRHISSSHKTFQAYCCLWRRGTLKHVLHEVYMAGNRAVNEIWNKKFWEVLIAYFPLLRHGPHIKRRNKQFFHSSVYICCRGNVFT
jgi:hypothetical protein